MLALPWMQAKDLPNVLSIADTAFRLIAQQAREQRSGADDTERFHSARVARHRALA